MEIGIITTSFFISVIAVWILVKNIPEETYEELINLKLDLIVQNYKYFQKEEEMLQSFDTNYDFILKNTLSTNKISDYKFNTEVELYYKLDDKMRKKLNIEEKNNISRIKILKIPKLKLSYDENGKIHGLFTAYYFSGEIMMTGKFHHGFMYGAIKRYSKEKHLLEIKNYENGAIQDTQYYSNGQVYKRWNIVDGCIDGECLTYYENGQIKESISYVKGKTNGKILYYYSNGQLKKEYYAVNNNYEGVWKFFYCTGEIMAEGVFSNNFLSNKIKKYDLKGNIIGEISLVNKVTLDKLKLKESIGIQKYSLKDLEKSFQKIFRHEEQLIKNLLKID
ncbi:toxin-antitoxin system YwqK family antitoxin [Fusobacterium sp. PH5-44]|uniref:toxin-antitoxin system YwqK family antitoxin n=1 Tax=unclassified Fusobacterium TaxID=2648384 RepID=UPI003D24FA9D